MDIKCLACEKGFHIPNGTFSAPKSDFGAICLPCLAEVKIAMDKPIVIPTRTERELGVVWSISPTACWIKDLRDWLQKCPQCGKQH
jgi:hypothetical protein